MNVYIITHGEKDKGVNPRLTEAGKTAITNLSVPNGITQVIVGTGRRFADVFTNIKDRVGNVPVKYSPLCGSADSGEKSETGFEVILADGTIVNVSDYLGLVGTPGVDLVAWLESLPNGTLLCAGREFLKGIGYEDGVPGRLYHYNGAEVTQIG